MLPGPENGIGVQNQNEENKDGYKDHCERNKELPK